MWTSLLSPWISHLNLEFSRSITVELEMVQRAHLAEWAQENCPERWLDFCSESQRKVWIDCEGNRYKNHSDNIRWALRMCQIPFKHPTSIVYKIGKITTCTNEKDEAKGPLQTRSPGKVFHVSLVRSRHTRMHTRRSSHTRMRTWLSKPPSRQASSWYLSIWVFPYLCWP